MASQPAVPESPLLVQDPGFANPAALLKHLAETPRLARVTSATRLEVRPAPEMVPFGIDALDQLTGGLPRGCLTEISGPDSSGRTSVLLATLAAATRRGEICALIDASDAFHPRSAVAAGIDLTRLLWIRCTPASAHEKTPNFEFESEQNHPAKGIPPSTRGTLPRRPTTESRHPALQEDWQRRRIENPVEQALRAADLLLQSGGFGLIAIDLAGVPVKIARRIPLTTWFRFRRAIEPTPTILLTVGEVPCAQTCATLCLQMAGQEPSLVADRHSVAQEALGGESPFVPSLSSGRAQDGRWSMGKKPPAFSTQHSAVSGQLSAPEQGSALAERSLELVARSSQLEAPPHAHLLEGLPIRVELLRSRLERKPAQSVTTFFSLSTDLPGRDEACPISDRLVAARSVSTRNAANNVNAFTLRAHPLRAHG